MKTFFLSALLVAASCTAALAQTQPPVDPWATTPGFEPTTAETAPASGAQQYNMGWSTAPGIPLSLHNRPSTDYWGRPLKKKAKNMTTVSAQKEVAYAEEEVVDPMMKSSGVSVAPGMSSSPYRGVSTDSWGRPLKKKTSKGASTLAKKVEKTAPVASVSTATSW